MIAAYIRSSSLNQYEMCPLSYFIQYNLGLIYPSNKAAEKGSIVHKVMEVLAVAKKNQQENNLVFLDDHFGELPVKVNLDDIIDKSYDLYRKESVHNWTKADYRDCRDWTYKCLDYNNGMLDPRFLNVFSAEKKFDITLEQEWAAYDYDMGNGNRLKGQLALKGTIDLIVEHKNKSLEIIDWKTGQRKDWAKDKVKGWEDLKKDKQLRFYHYVVSKLYPEYKDIFFTIFFIKDGGAFTLDFDESTVEESEQMIKGYFQTISTITTPKLKKRWWMGKMCPLCPYSKNKLQGSNKIICTDINNSIKTYGITNTLNKYSQIKDFTAYGAGGGRSEEQNKERKIE